MLQEREGRGTKLIPALSVLAVTDTDVCFIIAFISSGSGYVAVINASFVPSGVADESEVIPVLYVAFTRATRELLVTCYRENSISRHLEDFA